MPAAAPLRSRLRMTSLIPDLSPFTTWRLLLFRPIAEVATCNM